MAGQAGRKILALARAELARNDLNSVILSVREGSRTLITRALGTTMTGIPATTKMHFRVGSVAFAYLSTLLLKLRDEGRLSLNERLSRFFPSLPHASQVTLARLIETRSGYADYVAQPGFLKVLNAHPFRQWTPRELVAIGTNPKLFGTPGKFRYAHTNFVLLGAVLAKIMKMPLARLMRQQIFRPLGLTGTNISSRPPIPAPVLHAFITARGVYQESTFWNPSWTAGTGEIVTSDVGDLIRSAIGIGTGALLTKRSYRRQTAHISHVKPGVFYGMGIFINNDWLLQNPLFSGYNAVMAYLPARHISIAVTTTLGPRSNPNTNYSTNLTREIAAYLAPSHPIS
ncbi:MAG TPA: serine hydrolase domain-containing protein [Streptosporangiaceae bacterium]|nr:serine hydrolase domain-containing protein [Streptosporangiaceae bacterium]